MSDPSLNLANLVTIEDIYTAQQGMLSSANDNVLYQLKTEIFGLLSDVTYSVTTPIGNFVITNNITDASGNLYDNPTITCAYTWDVAIDIDTQKILKFLANCLKKLKLRVFLNNDMVLKTQTLTIYYPSLTDKLIISG